MDTPTLPETLKQAGADYQKRLRLLGLDPEGLLWAYANKDQKFHLWIIWSGVDMIGPYRLAKLLFRAYNLSALPQEIDPFVVQALSPKHPLAIEVRHFAIGPWEDGRPTEMQFASKADEAAEDLTWFSQSWIYKFDKRSQPPKRIMREWEKFQSSVDALAA